MLTPPALTTKVAVLPFQQVCMFHLGVIRWAENLQKTLCDHGQINIALQQVWPWTCYFLWGWTEQLGMNGIITHTHTEAPLQVHMGIQADRSKQIQTEKSILPNNTTRKYMQRHTQSWAVGIWNKSGREKSWKEDNPLSLYCEFLQSNRKALTEIFDLWQITTKWNTLSNKEFSKVLWVRKWWFKGICCQDELLDISWRYITLDD